MPLYMIRDNAGIEGFMGINGTMLEMLFQRKFREQGNPWELCKGFDSSAAIGTFVPVEHYKDIQNLNFNLLIDGKEVQRGCTADMLFKIDDIIAYVSQFVTLKIGDLLFTGTPVGVGPVKMCIRDRLSSRKTKRLNI